MENKEKFIKDIKGLLPTQEQIGFNNPAYAFGWVDAVNAIGKLVKESDSLPCVSKSFNAEDFEYSEFIKGEGKEYNYVSNKIHYFVNGELVKILNQ